MSDPKLVITYEPPGGSPETIEIEGVDEGRFVTFDTSDIQDDYISSVVISNLGTTRWEDLGYLRYHRPPLWRRVLNWLLHS